MMTIVYSFSFCHAKILDGRRLTEEEKTHYADWAKETMFISLGTIAELDFLKIEDMPKRKSDGQYNGTNNSAWIITDEEREAYVLENTKREKESIRKEMQERIELLEWRMSMMKNQKDFPSPEEARRRMKEYNDIFNEGGEGYVPHVYNVNEYINTQEELAELKERLQNV